MLIVTDLLLLVSSLLLTWHNRPAARGQQWPGSAAARFAAGLMIIGYAAASLLYHSSQSSHDHEIASSELLMRQLALYAALPMLVSTHLAERLRYHFTRQTWGRIFLGWCVVFELGRRSGVLEWVLLATLVAGGTALLLPFLLRQLALFSDFGRQQRFWYLTFPPMSWIILHLAPANIAHSGLTSLWLAILLGLLMLAQPVSYRMATAK